MRNADTVLEITCWRAGCGESRTTGSGGGGWKSGTIYCALLAGLLPY